MSAMIFIIMKLYKLEPVASRYYYFNWKKVKYAKESAVCDHIFCRGHNPSFDDFETILKNSHEFLCCHF